MEQKIKTTTMKQHKGKKRWRASLGMAIAIVSVGQHLPEAYAAGSKTINKWSCGFPTERDNSRKLTISCKLGCDDSYLCWDSLQEACTKLTRLGSSNVDLDVRVSYSHPNISLCQITDDLSSSADLQRAIVSLNVSVTTSPGGDDGEPSLVSQFDIGENVSVADSYSCGNMPSIHRFAISGGGMKGDLNNILDVFSPASLSVIVSENMPLLHWEVSDLLKFPLLKQLSFEDTPLRGSLANVSQLHNLVKLRVEGPIIGKLESIPSELGLLNETLVSLKLGSPSFNGSIPESLGVLKKLTTLSIQGENLQPSPVPDFIFTLQNLTSLSLKNSNRVGSVPQMLANLNSLNFLDLSRNTFSGRVPDNFSLSSKLSIDLDSNVLTGEFAFPVGEVIPAYINLNGNKFQSISVVKTADSYGKSALPENDGSNALPSQLQIFDQASLAALPENLEPGFYVMLTSLKCTCELMKNLWHIAEVLGNGKYFHAAGTTCIYEQAKYLSSMQLPIANYAGGPCLHDTSYALLKTVYYEKDALTMSWSAPALPLTYVSVSARDPLQYLLSEDIKGDTFVSRYGGCTGCVRFSADSPFFNSSSTGAIFFFVRFKPVRDASDSCCMVVPQRVGLNQNYTKRVDRHSVDVTAGYASVTAVRFVKFGIGMPHQQALVYDFQTETQYVLEPATFSVINVGDNLFLKYDVANFTAGDGNGSSRLHVYIVDPTTDAILKDHPLVEASGMLHMSKLLASIPFSVNSGAVLLLRVFDESSSAVLFSSDLNVVTKPVLVTCPSGHGANGSGNNGNDTQVTSTSYGDTCQLCPQGMYSTGKMVVCHKCPMGRTTAVEGSVSAENCSVADVGYLKICSSSSSNCDSMRQCRPEMNCSSEGTTLENLILKPGYWRPNLHTLEIFRCPTPRFCTPEVRIFETNGTSLKVAARHLDSVVDGTEYLVRLCSPNHKGIVCNSCVGGYGLSDDGCEECTDEVIKSQHNFIMVFVILLGICLLFPFLRQAHLATRSNGSMVSSTTSFRCRCFAWCFRAFNRSDSSSCTNQKGRTVKNESASPLTLTPQPGPSSPGSDSRSERKIRRSKRGLWLYFEKCGRNKLIILVSFLQIYLCFARFFDVEDLPFHSALVNGLVRISCVVPDQHYLTLVFWTSVPLLFVVSYALAVPCVSSQWQRIEARIETWNVITFILWIVFPSTSSVILATFPCTMIGDESYLLSDLKTVCSGTTYTWWVAYAGVMIGVFVVGIPALVGGILFRNSKLLSMEKWTTEQREEVRHLSFLYFPYTCKAYWFELYEFARKFVQVAAVVFLKPPIKPVAIEENLFDGFSTTLQSSLGKDFPQVICSLFLSISALFMLQIIQPYRNRFDSAYASISMANLCAVCISVVVLTNKDSSSSALHQGSSSNSWIVGSILLFELLAAVVLGIYDVFHLGQYPDREDEMRVKMKRNFYHSTIPTHADSEPPASFSTNNLLHLQDASFRAFATDPFGSQPTQTRSMPQMNMDSPMAETPPAITPMSLRFMSSSGSARRLPRLDQIDFRTSLSSEVGGHLVFQTPPGDNETSTQGFATAGDSSADSTFRRIGKEAITLFDVQFTSKGYNGHVGPMVKSDIAKFGLIGCGANGTVSIGVDLQSFRLVAMKEASIHDAPVAKQAVREALALDANGNGLSRLHDNPPCDKIIRLYNAFYDARTDSVCLITEYMEGGTLQNVIDDHKRALGISPNKLGQNLPNLIRRRQTVLDTVHAKENAKIFPEAWIGADQSNFEEVAVCNEAMLARIAKDMLLALDHMHAQGYLHLDIKPANVLINSAGHAKLADFGLAQRLSDYSRQDGAKFIGTLKYMSPERLRGQHATFASDIWSFGLTLLACTLGKYPLQFNSDGVPEESQRELYWLLLDRLDRNKEVLEIPEFVVVRSTVSSPRRVVAFSDAFRNFVASALDIQESTRPTARQLLQHPWIQSHSLEDDVEFGKPPTNPLFFDESCVALDRISSAIMSSFARNFYRAKELDSRRPNVNSETASLASTPSLDAVLDTVCELPLKEEQVSFLSQQLGLSKEIVKYSLLVAGDGARVKIVF